MSAFFVPDKRNGMAKTAKADRLESRGPRGSGLSKVRERFLFPYPAAPKNGKLIEKRYFFILTCSGGGSGGNCQSCT